MDIKELAKKLCDESGCHHKCKEIDECVVMEEAEELLISQDNRSCQNDNAPKIYLEEHEFINDVLPK